MKALISKYKDLLLQSYWILYLAWFMLVERLVTTKFHVIHMNIDDKIPFMEIFVIPYFLWFAYVAAGFVYTYIYDRIEYRKMCCYLFVGMTIFLIISTIYPNGHYLRPTLFERDNIFTHLVQMLYATDTATNLFPSIHVFNSIGVHLAIARCQKTKQIPLLRHTSLLLAVSIVLSTVFLKQHSMFDVITAFIMAIILYRFVYSKSNQLASVGRPQKRQVQH